MSLKEKVQILLWKGASKGVRSLRSLSAGQWFMMERAFRSQDFIAEMDRVPCIRHSASVGALPPLSIIPEKADLVCFAISRILHFEGERWAYVLQVDRIPATTCNGLRGRGESRSARTFEAFDVV